MIAQRDGRTDKVICRGRFAAIDCYRACVCRQPPPSAPTTVRESSAPGSPTTPCTSSGMQRQVQSVQKDLCYLTIQCNPSLAYMLHLESSQRNARVQSFLLADQLWATSVGEGEGGKILNILGEKKLKFGEHHSLKNHHLPSWPSYRTEWHNSLARA